MRNKHQIKLKVYFQDETYVICYKNTEKEVFEAIHWHKTNTPDIKKFCIKYPAKDKENAMS